MSYKNDRRILQYTIVAGQKRKIIIAREFLPPSPFLLHTPLAVYDYTFSMLPLEMMTEKNGQFLHSMMIVIC